MPIGLHPAPYHLQGKVGSQRSWNDTHKRGDSHMNRFIRRYLFVMALLPLQAARGQSMDIGGIEIALGENTRAALERLRKSFAVVHMAVLDSGTAKSWAVFAKFGTDELGMGSLREMSG